MYKVMEAIRELQVNWFEWTECIYTYICCLVPKSCPTVCDPMDCSPPGSSVHGISQARILEWIAISFSRGSSQPRDQTLISCISKRILYHWAAIRLTHTHTHTHTHIHKYEGAKSDVAGEVAKGQMMKAPGPLPETTCYSLQKRTGSILSGQRCQGDARLTPAMLWKVYSSASGSCRSLLEAMGNCPWFQIWEVTWWT